MNETDHGTGHLAGGNGSPDRWERVTPQVTPTPPTPLTPPTSGDGRRPTTGSRACGASGSAALGEIEGQVRFADLRRVIAALPPPLVAALEAEHSACLPTSITDAIEAELRRGLTAEQMAARINKRWNLHGYALDADTAYGGRGLQRPVGVAVALVRRGDCTHPRCNDGTDLDTGEACRTCERTRQDFHAERAAAPPTLRPVPHTGPRDPSPPSGVPGQMPMLLAVQDDGEHDQKQPDDLPRCAGCGKPLLRPGRPTHVGCA